MKEGVGKLDTACICRNIYEYLAVFSMSIFDVFNHEEGGSEISIKSIIYFGGMFSLGDLGVLV